MKRLLDASRVLIASSVVLAAALAFLLYQRFRAPPPAPPPAAAAAGAPADQPRGVEPGHAPARPAEARPAEDAARAAGELAKPAEAAAHAAAEPPKIAEAPAPAPAPAAGQPAQPATASAGTRPRPKRQGASTLADDAAVAIFGDRPAAEGEGSRQKTPRIPVLRKPAAGVAPAAYAAAMPRQGASPPSSGGARPPAAPRATAAPPPAAASSHATAPAPLPGPTPYPAQARAAPGGQPLPGAVSGTLRGAGSAPIAGTAVLAVSAAGDDAFETVSDDDGFYLLSGLKSGRYLLFTGLGARPAPALPARAVEVQDGRVARLDLREPGAGGTVRVRPLLADGRPLAGQALLVAGTPPSAGAFPALLRSDAVFLPEAGAPTVLRRVPAGVYTLVVLQADATLRVAKQPVTVRGDGEQVLEVRFPADLAAAGG